MTTIKNGQNGSIPAETTKEEYEQEQKQKRLQRIDTHTLLAGEFATVKSLSTLELQKLLEGRTSYSASKELLQTAQITFKERLGQASETELGALRGSTSDFIRKAALGEIEARKQREIDPLDQDVTEV